ncbi:OmpA family protein [Bizionia gelidisalsuginis]|uniref:OmpA family protein n=1 Tax=Bizionia gelidisalsuginis TaxID=291188 RepID=A0ABY3MCG0_9FLAO|nr:OmpA family protein [Bizionia gelidisalsuginis]TYC15610.1 OmpA family protein [Bizionia gelidisalsuginis]
MNKVLFILFLVTISVYSQNEITHDVYFDTDKYNVPLTEENRLLLFISELDSVDIGKVSIYGFTDDRGTRAYNLDLSQNRADAIKEMFAGYGIYPDLITNVDGKGIILLKVLNENEINKIRGLNRKVEIIVSPKLPEKKERKNKTTEAEEKPGNTLEKTIEDLTNGTLKKGDKIRLDKIYFKTNYSYITTESRKTLENIAKILVKHDTVYFTIQGHVCCTQMSRDAIDKKTKKRNLSVARAHYIYDYLARKGVDKRRMKYVGLRRKFPLGGAPKFDRRVEIIITYVAKNKN